MVFDVFEVLDFTGTGIGAGGVTTGPPPITGGFETGGVGTSAPTTGHPVVHVGVMPSRVQPVAVHTRLVPLGPQTRSPRTPEAIVVPAQLDWAPHGVDPPPVFPQFCWIEIAPVIIRPPAVISSCVEQSTICGHGRSDKYEGV
jgi:hypothetical protein